MSDLQKKVKNSSYEPNGFSKVKVKPGPGKTTVRLERAVGGDVEERDEHDVTLPNLPHPDLHSALQDLKSHFLDIMDLSPSVAENVRITGLEVKGMNPPEVKVYANRELNLGETISETTPTATPIDGEASQAMNEVIMESILMILGKRKQFNLFENGGADALEAGDDGTPENPEVSTEEETQNEPSTPVPDATGSSPPPQGDLPA